MSDENLTMSEFLAARILVDRLRCYAAKESWDSSKLGVKWTEGEPPVLGKIDDTHEIKGPDLMVGALALLWALTVEVAQALKVEPADAVSKVGLVLAAKEPVD